MEYSFSKLRITPHRFKNNFEALAQIGVTYDGGVHRPTFGYEYLQAHNWFQEQNITVGLEFRQSKVPPP